MQTNDLYSMRKMMHPDYTIANIYVLWTLIWFSIILNRTIRYIYKLKWPVDVKTEALKEKKRQKFLQP